MTSSNINHEGEDWVKNELDRQLNQAEKKGKKLSKHGREYVKSGQDVQDIVDSIKGVTKYYCPPNSAEVLIHGLVQMNDQLDYVIDELGEIRISGVISTVGSTAYSSTGVFNLDVAREFIEPGKWPIVEKAIINIHSIPERISNKEEVIELMKTFGLDLAISGKKSPLELFITAHNAFEKPVMEGNPVSTSLIPLRECVRLTIDFLLKARPDQEKTGSERNKIISIGKQLKFDELNNSIIISWADQWEDLLSKELSPSKEADITRNNWRDTLNKSTLFIKNILSGIDPKKMRNK